MFLTIVLLNAISCIMPAIEKKFLKGHIRVHAGIHFSPLLRAGMVAAGVLAAAVYVSSQGTSGSGESHSGGGRPTAAGPANPGSGEHKRGTHSLVSAVCPAGVVGSNFHSSLEIDLNDGLILTNDSPSGFQPTLTSGPHRGEIPWKTQSPNIGEVYEDPATHVARVLFAHKILVINFGNQTSTCYKRRH